MIRLNHSGTARPTVMASSCNDFTPTILLQPIEGTWPSPKFVITVDRGKATEEKMLVVGVAPDGSSFTVERGYDSTIPQVHFQGSTVEHTVSAVELQWVSDHMSASTAHGTTSPLVGVDDLQVLTNKVIDGGLNEITVPVGNIIGLPTLVEAIGVHAGMVAMFAVASVRHVGWLLCDGSSLSVTDHAALYEAIGDIFTTPTTPDGQFGLPDLPDPLPGIRFFIFSPPWSDQYVIGR